MNISRFFIDRPIFAAVVAMVITIIGAIGYAGLGIAQLPEITPPTMEGTRTVVSDTGVSLSPKYAPEITAPAVITGSAPINGAR